MKLSLIAKDGTVPGPSLKEGFAVVDWVAFEAWLSTGRRRNIVRIRRKITRSRYQQRTVYKYHRYELTIPAKYKDLAEAFMNKDLQVQAKQENNALIMVAKPTGKFSSQ